MPPQWAQYFFVFSKVIVTCHISIQQIQACSQEQKKIVPPPSLLRACKNRHAGTHYAALLVRDNLWRLDAVFTSRGVGITRSSVLISYTSFCFTQLTELCTVLLVNTIKRVLSRFTVKAAAFKYHTDPHIIKHILKHLYKNIPLLRNLYFTKKQDKESTAILAALSLYCSVVR